jgi:hypothetical protein
LAANVRHEQPRPLIAPLPSLILLGRAALVLEGNDALGRAAHVGDDEADADIPPVRARADDLTPGTGRLAADNPTRPSRSSAFR